MYFIYFIIHDQGTDARTYTVGFNIIYMLNVRMLINI